MREVVDLFLQTTPVRLEALRQMGLEGDAGAFLTLCHSLRGASLQLGATEMAEHCARLEAALRRGDRTEAHVRLDALGEAFERERQRLEPQRGPAARIGRGRLAVIEQGVLGASPLLE